MDAELIFDARNATGESPVWSVREQALYWVDIPAGRLYRWNAADSRTQSWKAPQMLACIAAHSSGGWIAGMESGLFHLQPGEGESLTSTLLAGVEHGQPGMRFNDGRCDRQGRFWAGTMLLDMAAGVPAGALYRYSAGQQQLNAQLHGYIVPNGLGFSPDGKTMYLSDSHPSVQKIWAFDYDTDSGTPHDRRLFVDMNDYPGRPDGAAVDSEGCYWICGNDAGLIHRFTPQGRLDRSVTVPVKKPTMCAFGGSGLDTLYITSIRPGGDIGDQPLAGGVFAFRPGVTGLEEPIFQS
ncbi:glucurono-1,5-lactonase [Pseudomonas lijiangensis]|uniref:SMP-30/gluconolactonase/LRE family protein n=1 Tax=Pseudomonas lijiangensis TaxID=2995658 RepID=A0ABX8HRW3_9PSED|nr:SMP-30/gluconolactonase/LRE family protein [Pseudomonas lijiangensis]MBX8502593.1 SMP-30/gluconolactonase/LRE family protein [Pseudomonas lijiangensis]MBX8507541.1 SMP-30/gluconolactonase/LRE family protein [Pseudomonas lijiangensis]QWU83340.1 SMP-30/gluconolactonase/LRE family protein [Pseudomonas lijiangensis]